MFSKNTKNIRQAIARLNVIRSGLEIYKTDHNGTFPRSLQELVPEYISSIPELYLPGHKTTSAVIDITTADGDLASSIVNSGGWLYFSAPHSPNYGKVVLDCPDIFNDKKLFEF
jgi:hypothetical protein